MFYLLPPILLALVFGFCAMASSDPEPKKPHKPAASKVEKKKN